jgi:hypothetical protein
VATHIAHLFGDHEIATVEALPALVAELDQADGEHTDVAVQHESGWALSAYQNGQVIWGNVEADAEVGQLTGVTRAEMVELFTNLVNGDIEAVASRPWDPDIG